MKFQVYQDGQLCKDFALRAPYLFGADSVALQSSNGAISFADGVIECDHKGGSSAGLALLWPVKGYGKILLPTTCLPTREEPYVLNVELARAKLMQITLKREDWAIFEESASFSRIAMEAKELFIESLKHIARPGKASKLADESLQKSLEYAEKLALKHGEVFVGLRAKSKGLNRHTLGCEIDPSLVDDEKYRKWLLETFGFVTIPVNWAHVEPQKGEYNFDAIDKCIDMMRGKRLAVCAGPLLRFAKDCVPKWLTEDKIEFGKLREASYHFVAKIIGRYKGYIHTWQVISGMNALNCFGCNFEQIVEMTRAACLAGKSADVRSRKVIEVLYPWGEYYATNKFTVPPLVYVDTVIQSGIAFDAFGIRFLFGLDVPGMHVRDMMQVSSRLDSFLPVPKPLHVTGVAVPDRGGMGTQDCDSSGIWHRHWDEDLQGQWLEQFYRIALGKPFVNSVTYSYLADSDRLPMEGAGLLNDKLEPKKSFMTLVKLQKMILKK